MLRRKGKKKSERQQNGEWSRETNTNTYSKWKHTDSKPKRNCIYTLQSRHGITLNQRFYKCLWRQFKARKDGFVAIYFNFFYFIFFVCIRSACYRLYFTRIVFARANSPLLADWSHAPKWFPNKNSSTCRRHIS